MLGTHIHIDSHRVMNGGFAQLDIAEELDRGGGRLKIDGKEGNLKAVIARGRR